MHLGAHMVSDKANDPLAVGRGHEDGTSADPLAEPVDPEAAVGVEHDFDDLGVGEPFGYRAAERGTQHACAAALRLCSTGLDGHGSPRCISRTDASGSTGGIDFATFITDYFAGLSGGAFTFYGGEAASQYKDAEQIAFNYKEGTVATTDRVVLGGTDLAYDMLGHGTSYGHGISGSLDSLTFGQWVDGVTSGTPGAGDAGILTVEIGIAPVKPAEFVVFRISQFNGGAGIEE